MQLLFVILFGAVVSFILYLSYRTHVIEKKNSNKNNNTKELIETENISKEEITEKVDNKIIEQGIVNDDVDGSLVKFKARRLKKMQEDDEEEII